MLIHHHLGLGDHIICNGLVSYLSQSNPIRLFCKHQNLVNIRTMYQNNTNIELIAVTNDKEAQSIGSKYRDYIKLGISLNPIFVSNKEWDEIFYIQIGLPYDISWSYFDYYQPASQNKIPNSRYAFLCSKGSDGVDGVCYKHIDPTLEIVHSDQGNFFDNLNLIENATEIHCINSAYIHLIDRITTSHDTNLVYHKNFISKPYSDFTLKKKWHVI